MTVLIAIDPSTTCTGIAVFDGGRLESTKAAAFDTYCGRTFERSDNLGARARNMAESACWRMPRPDWTGGPVTSVVAEWPQAYGDDVDPNDLFVIAAIGVAIGMRYPNATFSSVKPAEWTGQIPKTTERKGKKSLRKADLFTNPRAHRIIARLDEAELRVFHDITTYDELDAVGIGLHALGRGITQRHRVYPGAT